MNVCRKLSTLLLCTLTLVGCELLPKDKSYERTVAQTEIESTDVETLCTEGFENSWRYTDETFLRYRAEIEKRNLDCSTEGREARAIVNSSSENLCVATIVAPSYFPHLLEPAKAELARRAVTCDPQQTQLMVQVFLTKQQQDAQLAQAEAARAQAQAEAEAERRQNAANALLMLQAMQPKPTYQAPPPLPRPVNCTSRAIGSTVNTSCY